jgi:hypothetical protein
VEKPTGQKYSGRSAKPGNQRPVDYKVRLITKLFPGRVQRASKITVLFHDPAAREVVDKVMPNDVRQTKFVLRIPELGQEIGEPVFHALRSLRVCEHVASGLLPVNPEQVIVGGVMVLVLIGRRCTPEPQRNSFFPSRRICPS